MSGDNIGPTLIRAVNLPLRDVHDVCATGDIDYLIAFANDEQQRIDKGLGRAHAPTRKVTSPVRRAEYLQSSKVAAEIKAAEDRKELAARAKKREENRRRRKAEAEAAAREDRMMDGGGNDSGRDSDADSVEDARRAAAAAAAAAADEQFDEEGAEDDQDSVARAKAKALLLSTGAGSTDDDKVPCEPEVFPRPHLGKVSDAAGEDAAFNTVGFGVVSVYDLVNFRDEHGFLPIHTAVVFGNTGIVDWLLDHGADVECAVPGSLLRPIHLAVMNKHDSLARRLVETYSADPGSLTAKFESPLTLARNIRFADLQLFFKVKCIEKIQSSNALMAAYSGEVLYFALYIEIDEDGGKKRFTEDYVDFRPKDRAPDSVPGGPAISLDMVLRDPVSTPLDVAVAAINPSAPEYMLITQLLLRGNFFKLNELRESPIATTTLYLAVSMPTSREGIKLLIEHGADPRVASVFNAAPNQMLKLMMAEAEAKIVLDEFYATRDEVSFEERAEFVSKVQELRFKWRKAQHVLQKALDREEAIAASQQSD